MYENLEKPSPSKCASIIKIINLISGYVLAYIRGFITAFGAVGIVYMAIHHLFSF